MNLDAARVLLAIGYVNRRRESRSNVAAVQPTGDADEAAARLINELFEANEKLVVYGTLLPGESNHHVLAPLGDSWSRCTVHGTLHEKGWGAVIGFPAIRLDPGAPAVNAKMLSSAALPDHWARLDRFEGDEYRRVLVPVHDGRDIVAVANIYEAREIHSS